MKKILILIAAVMLMASNLWAADICTQSVVEDLRGKTATLTLVCTGTNTSTAITAANLAKIKGTVSGVGTRYLVTAWAWPTSGGTAPDAADVTFTMNNLDLLGGKGANLINATATQATLPYNTVMSSYWYPQIKGSSITIATANQGTAAANYTLQFDFGP
jgi:hypothetical protein